MSERTNSPDFKAIYPNLVHYMLSTGSIPPKYAVDLGLVNEAVGKLKSELEEVEKKYALEHELAQNMEDIADGFREESHTSIAKLQGIKWILKIPNLKSSMNTPDIVLGFEEQFYLKKILEETANE